MLQSIVFFEGLWDALVYAPTALAILGGVLIGIGLFTACGWQPTCRRCRHDLRGVTEPRCPECGADLDARAAVRAGRRQLRPLPTALGLLLIAAAVAPLVGYTPSAIRRALAGHIDRRTIYRANLSQNRFAQQIHQQLLAAGDSDYAAMLLEENLRHLENDPFVGQRDPALQDLAWLSQRSPLRREDQLRIAAALVARAAESEATARSVRDCLVFMHYLNDPAVQPELLKSDALIGAFVSVTAPSRALRGRPLMVTAAWSALTGLTMALEPQVTAMRWRRVGSADWAPVPMGEQFNRRIAEGLDVEGDIELEATAEVVVPRGAVARGSPERTVTVRQVLTISIVSPDSIRITGVRGDEAHAELEPMLATMRLTRLASTVQVKFGFPAGRGRSRAASIRFGGDFVIVYDGTSYPVGTYVYASGGGGGGGSGGDAGFGLLTLDPAKPIVVRIEPNVAAVRGRIQDDVTFLDEIIEAEFPGLDQPPSAIRWIEPSTR